MPHSALWPVLSSEKKPAVWRGDIHFMPKKRKTVSDLAHAWPDKYVLRGRDRDFYVSGFLRGYAAACRRIRTALRKS